MILRNLYIIDQSSPVDIMVQNGTIINIGKGNSLVSQSGPEIRFSGANVIPGLINSHDHLDFNSFSMLGNRLYGNYQEWGQYIHQNNKRKIESILKIPVELRIRWGIYKNLLNGFTTVIQHGQIPEITENIIEIRRNAGDLHSIKLEKKIFLKLNNPVLYNHPAVIHIGEGTDNASEKEINTLIRWNFLRRPVIGIHGIAMNQKQASRFSALVWCPASNDFLYGKGPEIHKLKSETSLLFGTDSTLSAGWNAWDHFRMARQSGMLSDTDFFFSLTTGASSVWNLKNKGSISLNFDADLVIYDRSGSPIGFDGFFNTNPQNILMVIKKGEIIYFDKLLKDDVIAAGSDISQFGPVLLNGRIKYLKGNPEALIQRIRSFFPDAEFPVDII